MAVFPGVPSATITVVAVFFSKSVQRTMLAFMIQDATLSLPVVVVIASCTGNITLRLPQTSKNVLHRSIYSDARCRDLARDVGEEVS